MSLLRDIDFVCPQCTDRNTSLPVTHAHWKNCPTEQQQLQQQQLEQQQEEQKQQEEQQSEQQYLTAHSVRVKLNRATKLRVKHHHGRYNKNKNNDNSDYAYSSRSGSPWLTEPLGAGEDRIQARHNTESEEETTANEAVEQNEPINEVESSAVNHWREEGSNERQQEGELEEVANRRDQPTRPNRRVSGRETVGRERRQWHRSQTEIDNSVNRSIESGRPQTSLLESNESPLQKEQLELSQSLRTNLAQLSNSFAQVDRSLNELIHDIQPRTGGTEEAKGKDAGGSGRNESMQQQQKQTMESNLSRVRQLMQEAEKQRVALHEQIRQLDRLLEKQRQVQTSSESSHRRRRRQSSKDVGHLPVRNRGEQITDPLLQERLAKALHTATEAKEVNRRLRVERDVARHELDSCRYNCRMLSADLDDRQLELLQLRRELGQRDDQMRQLGAELVTLRQEMGRNDDCLKNLHRQLDAAKRRAESEAAAAESERRRTAQLMEELHGKERELATVTNALAEKREAEDTLQFRIRLLQQDLANSQAIIKNLRSAAATNPKPKQNRDAAVQHDRREQNNKSSQVGSPPKVTDSRSTPRQLKETVDEASPDGEQSEDLEQRMRELDARINQLIVETATTSRANPFHAQSPSADWSDQPLTSTPSQAPVETTLANENSMKFELSRLQADRDRLLSDVRSLRSICSELMESRSRLKRQSQQQNQQQQKQEESLQRSQPTRSELSRYLLETERLRALIDCEMRDLNSGCPGDIEPLRAQQEAVNRSWESLRSQSISDSRLHVHPIRRMKIHPATYSSRLRSYRRPINEPTVSADASPTQHLRNANCHHSRKCNSGQVDESRENHMRDSSSCQSPTTCTHSCSHRSGCLA